MAYDERWLADVLARGDVRLAGGNAPPAPPAITERAFMQALRREALANNYLFYHTFDSRRSAPGFIDAVLAKPGRPLLMWELKTTDGLVTLAQQRWIEVLGQVTHVEAGVYRPEAWESMVARLHGER
jgi:hypothetical protein